MEWVLLYSPWQSKWLQVKIMSPGPRWKIVVYDYPCPSDAFPRMCTGQAVRDASLCFSAEYDVKYMHKIEFFAFTIPQALPFLYIELKNFANFFVNSGVIFFSGIIA